MFSSLRRLFSHKQRPQSNVRSRVQLHVECLQDRIVPSVSVSGSTLVVAGTPDADHVEVSGAPGALHVNFNGTESDYTQRIRSILFTGGDGADYFSNTTSIRVVAYGGNGNDTIIGGSGADKIYGDAGNDDLQGGGGNDRIYGGSDDDLLSGGSGKDRLYGDDGLDNISGDDDNDAIYGGLGDDSLHGGHGRDSLRGGDGNDDLYGDEYNDRLSGELGDDNLHGGTGRDSLSGGDGDDKLDGGLGRDSISGGDGSDDGVNLDEDRSRSLESGRQHDSNELVASLTGATAAFGKAKFETELEHGVTRNEFELELFRAPGNQTFDVVVDGVTVAQVTTSRSGAAELHLNSVAFTVINSSTVQVKDGAGNILVQGSFTIEVEDSGTETLYLASLTSSASAFGSGKFQIETEGGATKKEFEAQLRGGPAFKTLTVYVDGNSVGQLSTGDSGNGELELRDPTFDVTAGSLLEIKDDLGNLIVSGTFA